MRPLEILCQVIILLDQFDVNWGFGAEQHFAQHRLCLPIWGQLVPNGLPYPSGQQGSIQTVWIGHRVERDLACVVILPLEEIG